MSHTWQPRKKNSGVMSISSDGTVFNIDERCMYFTDERPLEPLCWEEQLNSNQVCNACDSFYTLTMQSPCSNVRLLVDKYQLLSWMKGSNVVNVEQYSRSWLKDRTLCMENVENALFIVMNLRKISITVSWNRNWQKLTRSYADYRQIRFYIS